MLRSIRVLTAGMAAALLLGSGCSADGGDAAADDKKPGQIEKVSFLTGFGLFGREAYIYVAKEKGYFQEAGLDVEVKSGAGTGENLKLLLAGQADYGVVDLTGALIEYGKTELKDFTVISAINQRTVTCIMSVEGRNISKPKDLEGKKIGYQPGGVNYTLFPAYAKLAGIDPSKVKWVVGSPQQLPQFLAAGTIDAQTQLVVGAPTVKNVTKKEPVVLPYSDFLTDLYGNALAVSKKKATENPDQVRRFNAAMLKGLEYSIDHPDEAGEIFAKFQKIQPPAVAAGEVKLFAPYVRPGGSEKIGVLDPARVARSIAIMQGIGLIPAGVTPEQVVTSEFLPTT